MYNANRSSGDDYDRHATSGHCDSDTDASDGAGTYGGGYDGGNDNN